MKRSDGETSDGKDRAFEFLRQLPLQSVNVGLFAGGVHCVLLLGNYHITQSSILPEWSPLSSVVLKVQLVQQDNNLLVRRGWPLWNDYVLEPERRHNQHF